MNFIVRVGKKYIANPIKVNEFLKIVKEYFDESCAIQ